MAGLAFALGCFTKTLDWDPCPVKHCLEFLHSNIFWLHVCVCVCAHMHVHAHERTHAGDTIESHMGQRVGSWPQSLCIFSGFPAAMLPEHQILSFSCSHTLLWRQGSQRAELPGSRSAHIEAKGIKLATSSLLGWPSTVLYDTELGSGPRLGLALN